MYKEKFESEVDTLKLFFEVHCADKHKGRNNFVTKLTFEKQPYEVNLKLCNACRELIEYSFNRLIHCPYDNKPRCRTCANPCYEKEKWKKLASLMRYSGIKLKLVRIKNFFKI
ncbi:nitrous oxide-stimulated promoter family protein [bacterium]|nr:nitrous oxide-stimulated promoter family protein [bacterium]MBU1993541.1 nitrous oxide-stimulated promoter family protein [bacterium]